jgi:23S rRNA pseudouridine1911/1915/1917 synthase
MTTISAGTSTLSRRRSGGSGPLEPEDDIDEDLPEAVVRVVIGDAPPDRLDRAIVRDAPEDAGISRSRLAKLFEEGAVSRGGLALGPRARFAPGDVIEIALPPPAPMAAEPEDIPLVVVFEDAELLVVDKPAGMVVHPAPGAPRGTLVNALLHRCGAGLSGIGGVWRPGIVHRIDKDTSGLLVVAKTDRAHQGLAAQFAAHAIDRLYLAVTHGAPSGADPRLMGLRGVAAEGGGVIRIATQIDRHPADRQRRAVVATGGKAAVTRLSVIEGFGRPPQAALCAFRLETGRTHQIRVHAAYLGHPLAGDPVYGGARKPSASALPDGGAAALAAFPRQALHAARLGFAHPVSGAQMAFDSPLPPDIAALVASLR